MDNSYNSTDDLNLAEKAGAGMLAIMFWCCTGGLMFVHIISFLVGATTLWFTVIAFFVAPVGRTMSGTLYHTNKMMQQYF